MLEVKPDNSGKGSSAAFKLCTAAGFFIFAFAVVFLARCLRGWAPKAMSVCNALAGGVLIAVALVHMLLENMEIMAPTGRAVTDLLGACHASNEDECESFPVGMAIFVLGLFAIVMVEVVSGHSHDSHDGAAAHAARARNVAATAESELEAGSETASQSDDQQSQSQSDTALWRAEEENAGHKSLSGTAKAVGAGTAVGVSVHSLIEGVALGSDQDAASFLSLLVAVLLHKGFTSFAVGSALVSANNRCLFWSGAIIYSLAAPVGIVAGWMLTNLESVWTAAFQCLAAGTLLGIGLVDMLLPAISTPDKTTNVRNLFVALGGATLMTVLAAWA
mmetsp:Transcript_86343/g.180693  ORF Transcript_86343/g.180693 Transcript_86343/m.180693 type:complete len:333 (-) Transcript_86343:288-1286(-)